MRFLSLLIVFLPILSTVHYAQTQTDYSKTVNWAALPSNLPQGLATYCQDTSLWSAVDVFYVYPTLNTQKKDRRWNVPIEDEQQRTKVLQTALPFQGSAFVEAGRFYSPYYRSAHLRSYYVDDQQGKDALALAYSDVRAAFLYYLEHYNQGRPIILAAHSQGSTHCGLLLQEFFDGKPLQKQLIAAYLPGIGILPSDLKNIPLLVGPEQTGGYLAWNTFKKRLDQASYEKWYKGRAVINPITWTTESFASKELHKGFLYTDKRIYKELFNTHLIDGAVWIDRPKGKFMLMSFTMRNYHIGDINLFWQDIRENAKLRAKNFLENK